jgi:predicted nucleic acid-binding protein
VMQYYFDTSVLVKRYYPERGSGAVDRFMREITVGSAMGVVSSLVLPETVSTINRKRNQGFINKKTFDGIMAILYQDLEFFRIIPVDEKGVVESVSCIIKHNLNSADALHLVAALAAKATGEEDVIFLSCDARLLRAAGKEKLQTLNPEMEEP